MYIKKNRNYINGKLLSHIVWNEHNPNNPWLPKSNLIVHHIDGDSLNDDISNLQLLTRSEHNVIHKIGNKNCKGRKHTLKTLKLMSEIKIGQNNPFWGKQHTENYKKEYSMRFSGKNNPHYGLRHSEDTKAKISEAKKKYWAEKKANSL